uniref:Ig-like domain-containing protein n=1 Tax=Oreochromis niloticus TaxID=8128 RepID=A0A669EYV7_ORENI
MCLLSSEIPVPTITETPKWAHVFPTESVKFKCGIGPDSFNWMYTWYRDGKQVNADGTVSFDANGAGLSISSASAGHTGKYNCSGKIQNRAVTSQTSSEVSLTVYAQKPTLTLTRDPDYDVMFAGEAVTFSCAISVQSEWTYLWYKDGSEVTGSSDKLAVQIKGTGNGGSYTCKATRGPNPAFITDSSAPEQLNVQEIPVPTITETPKWAHVFPTASVKFKCGIGPDSYNWIYTWYRDGKQVNADGTVSFNANGAGLSISSASAGHTGKYNCSGKIQNRAVTSQTSSEFSLTVYAQKPTLTLTRDPDYDVMFAGEAVTFSCAISVQSEWTYLWYKDGSEVTGSSDKLAVQIKGTGNGGSYTCKATRGPNPAFITDSSAPEQLNVQEIPVPTITETPKWTHVFPTESVKFKCGIGPDSYNWIYTWYRDGKQVNADGTVSFNANGAGLSISSASAGHTGKYKCSGKIQNRAVTSQTSSEFSLTVYAQKPTLTLTRDPDYDVMFPGEAVNFSCAISVQSEWKYLWYKDGSEVIGSSDKLAVQIKGTGNGGSYTCKATRGPNPAFITDLSAPEQLNVQELPKASIVLLTGWSDVFSTDSLILLCEVKESTHNWTHYTWLKEVEQIDSFSEKHAVTPSNDPDQSTYTCRAHADERPLYSKSSDSFKTKNLLLKRRVLLSISGCIVFGIAAVFIGCVALRVFRKPNGRDDKMEEVNLFPTMAELKITDVPCPLVEYITDASLNAPAKEEEEENGTVCSETTPLPITKQEDQAATTDNQETTETNGGLSSFLK